MIGSVFEQRDQLAALERRRQQIAAQSAQPSASNCAADRVTGGSVAAAPLAAAVPAAGYGAPGMALKSAEPDIGKRRKGKVRGRDMLEGQRAAMDAEAAGKATSVRGFSDGPGEPVMPGRVQPGQFDRPYIEAGHGAESPQSEPPRGNPVPAPYGQGVPVPIGLPGAASAAYVPAHVAAAYSMGSPSERPVRGGAR